MKRPAKALTVRPLHRLQKYLLHLTYEGVKPACIAHRARLKWFFHNYYR